MMTVLLKTTYFKVALLLLGVARLCDRSRARGGGSGSVPAVLLD